MGRARRAAWTVGTVALLATLGPGVAAAQAPGIFLTADATETGLVNLALLATPDSYVEVGERVGERIRPIAQLVVPSVGAATFPRAALWRCDRLTRRFTALATFPDGTSGRSEFGVRTPSCRRRLAVTAPRAARPGRSVAVKLFDRWRTGGIAPTVCVTAPGGRPACRAAGFPRGRSTARRSFRPREEGRWRLEVRLAGFVTRRTVRVGEGLRPRKPRGPSLPVILATGDSTLQGIDSFLAELVSGAARVRSDVAVGTGISKPNGRDWRQHARAQVARLRPRATVISLGAIDAFPLPVGGRKVECCDQQWIAEYTRRVRIMMRTYAQGGAAPVLWLKLPAPQGAGRAASFAAVNAAIERAATGLPAVRLVRLDDVFTPGGIYRTFLRRNGRRVRVREADGVHLTVPGTKIAAGEVLRALREAGAVRPAAAAAAGNAVQAPPELEADRPQTGYIRLRAHGPPGATVAFFELIDGRATALETTIIDPAGEAMLPRAATWRCDRRGRSFSAMTVAAGRAPETAYARLTTPSCAKRLALGTPRRARAGGVVRVSVRDRWRIGEIRPRLCTEAPGHIRRCRPVAIAAGAAKTSAEVKIVRAGRWLVSLRIPQQRLERTIRVRPRSGRLRVLATGDSMIQIVDGFLRARLGRRASLRSDAHISTGISKPGLLDWQAYAHRQAAGFRPDVTVMFLGANDGFPMAGAACCGKSWVREYARRAGGMMDAYARGGAARVLWLTLPAPRDGSFRRVFPKVNAAIRRAARRRPHVRIVRMDAVFTPGFRYRDRLLRGGRALQVRQPDGVHLNVAGAQIAADVIVRALRADRTL